MGWICDGSSSELDSEIIEFWEYVSQHLVLHELIFVFSSTVLIMKELVSQGEEIAWVRAFRKINVRKLTVQLWISDEETNEEGDGGHLSDAGSADDVNSLEAHYRDDSISSSGNNSSVRLRGQISSAVEHLDASHGSSLGSYPSH